MRGLRISICVTNLHSKSAQQICVIRDIYVRGVSLLRNGSLLSRNGSIVVPSS